MKKENLIDKIKRNSVELVSEEQLKYKIDRGNLNIKFGVDPTSKILHLGHLVPIIRLKYFQDEGHNVNFLIGDFTARIGDPSGKSSIRNKLEKKEIQRNLTNYKKIINNFLNPERTEIVYNSEWLQNMSLEEVLEVFSQKNINDLLKRKGVHGRLEKNMPVSMLEFVYPFMQAYDSLKLKPDIEIGGEDQYFNFLLTRELQQKNNMEPEVIITYPLLKGKDGEKMSSTADNYIELNQTPENMYGQIMSIKDELIIEYMNLITDTPVEKIKEYDYGMSEGKINPKDAKKDLANKIVSLIFGEKEADLSKKEFEKIYEKKGIPTNLLEIKIDKDNYETNFVNFLREKDIVSSNSEAKTLIKGNGLRYNNKTVSEPYENYFIKDGDIINIGKRRYWKITAK